MAERTYYQSSRQLGSSIPTKSLGGDSYLIIEELRESTVKVVALNHHLLPQRKGRANALPFFMLGLFPSFDHLPSPIPPSRAISLFVLKSKK